MGGGRLREELQALQRGRGVRRPGIRTWLGPLLCGLVAPHPEAVSDRQLREQLVELLVDAAQALPGDLCGLFLVASAIESDEPLLKKRLEWASTRYDRDARTLSRYLRRAEALLAELLIQAAEEVESPYDSGAWVTTRMEPALSVDRPRPVARVGQVIRSTREDLAEFRQTVAVAVPPVDDVEPVITGLQGCVLTGVRRASDRSWIATFDVPPPQLGRSRTTLYEVEFPDPESLQPFAAYAPLRGCASLEVRVQFDPDNIPAAIWRVDAVPTALVTDRPRGARSLTPREGRVAAEFTGLRPGYAYGLACSEAVAAAD